jgi:hypothetical protein
MRQISASLLFPVKKWRAEGSLALLARCQLGSMPNPGIDGPLRAEGIAHSRPGATALWGECLEMGTPGAIRPDNVSSQRAEEKEASPAPAGVVIPSAQWPRPRRG